MQIIKDKVVKNCHRITNTNLRIVNVLTYKERDYKTLKTHLNEAKLNPNNIWYIKNEIKRTSCL